MRKTASLLFVVFALFMQSCKTADDKIPEIASDFCNCFTIAEKDLSKETIDLFKKAANANDPQATMQEELMNLDDEVKMSVSTEIISLGKIEDKNSELGKCINNAEKKYGNDYVFNEEKFGQKIIKELESRADCSLTAAIMKLGLKMQKKNKD